MITLAELSDALGLKVYRDTRIYFWKYGFNTAKTKCRAYVYLRGGIFRVFCKIESRVQPKSWCRSEEKVIKESITREVSDAVQSIIKQKEKSYGTSKN